MPAARPENQFDENGASLRPCPICGKPAVFATRPFCSKRCVDIDLHRWLAGYYAVPASHDTNAEPDGPGEQRVAQNSEP